VAVLVTNQVMTVMKGTFAGEDAIGGNIVAHGCHFRIQFKAKGFSMNSSLERTATIVDAPDLAPESAQFFITEAGISDTETISYDEAEQDEVPVGEEISLTSAADLPDESIAEISELDASIVEDVQPKKKATKKKATKKRK
jgi:hypothetical protein